MQHAGDGMAHSHLERTSPGKDFVTVKSTQRTERFHPV